MNQNYFFLNRFIVEISDRIKNSSITEIFSQDKNKLVFSLKKGEDEFFLEICVAPGQSYINLLNDYRRAKKNTIDFFKCAAGQSVSSISIASDDRIIYLKLTNGNLYFAIRGKETNVYFFSSGDENSFKVSNERVKDGVKNELSKKKFTEEFNNPELNISHTDKYLDEIKIKFPFLGSDVIKEVKTRAKNDNDVELQNLLREVILEMKHSKPTLFIDEMNSNVALGFENFKGNPFTKKEIYNNLTLSQNAYFSKKYFFENKKKKLKIVEKHLVREKTKLANKINNLRAVLQRGSKEKEYYRFANLLLLNIKKIRGGMNEIELEDIYSSNERVRVRLRPNLSPQKNIDYYFDKSNDEKKSIIKSKELLKIAQADFNRLQTIENKLKNIESTKEVAEIMKELNIKSPGKLTKKEELKEKFKHYIIDKKYSVFVGRDSKNNDLLTTKFAKQNDIWFHAKSVSGSHVVLRVDNTKEVIPKNILEKIAALAAYHSKAKTAGIVPVAFTFKKYVVKRKGDPVGTVHLLREEVFLVKPEIPRGCDYVT